MHVLISGATGTGKTTLARIMARQAARSRPVLVFDVTGGYGWEFADHYDVIEDFLYAAKTTPGALVVCDETTISFERFDKSTYFLTTTIRHLGSKTVMISNRYKDLHISIRENISTLYMFRCTKGTQRVLDDDYDTSGLELWLLPNLHFVKLAPPNPPQRLMLDKSYQKVLKY